MKRVFALVFFVFSLSFAASAAEPVVLTGDVIRIDPSKGIKEFTIQRKYGAEFDTVTYFPESLDYKEEKKTRGYIALYNGQFGSPIEPRKGNRGVFVNGGISSMIVDSSEFFSETPYFLVLTFGDNYFSVKDGVLVVSRGVPSGF